MIEKKVGKINLMDIINNKEKFILNNNIFNKEDYIIYNSGELLAYKEMKSDFCKLNTNQFVDKYLKKIVEIKKIIDEEKDTDKIEKISGYNNAIVSILELIDPKYKYDLT